ncbi:MAG: cytochrome C assembly protein [Candidatus Eisenbacteria bacterium]|uniref:Heme exporter protein C n=1 Tax=Eiseniibacteriota bacterium TaxID=2212470 RepID=A0A538TQQ4_UNCEI|nr:MAG: cytochrome C assembly protein [Candidatus Eisenbacteria bacterium]
MNRNVPDWWLKGAKWLWIAALALVGISLLAIVFRAPVEAVMGPVQKIVYIHVPSAIVTLLAFGIAFGAGIAYLATKQWIWDAVGAASCEVGLVFATVVMITGPLWARSAWNTWWTWEPRLTTFFILWILYAAYQVIRASIRSSSKRTISAIMEVVFFVNLPIVWKSVEWWRGSLHPRSVTMTGEMRQVLLFSMLAWIVFFAAVLERRLRLEWAREAAARDAAARAFEPGEARRA